MPSIVLWCPAMAATDLFGAEDARVFWPPVKAVMKGSCQLFWEAFWLCNVVKISSSEVSYGRVPLVPAVWLCQGNPQLAICWLGIGFFKPFIDLGNSSGCRHHSNGPPKEISFKVEKSSWSLMAVLMVDVIDNVCTKQHVPTHGDVSDPIWLTKAPDGLPSSPVSWCGLTAYKQMPTVAFWHGVAPQVSNEASMITNSVWWGTAPKHTPSVRFALQARASICAVWGQTCTFSKPRRITDRGLAKSNLQTSYDTIDTIRCD